MPIRLGQARARLAIGIILAAALLLVLIPVVKAAVPGMLAAPTDPPLASSTPKASPGRTAASNSATATVECQFRQHGDVGWADEPGRIVSGRGWWEQGNCQTVQATVRVRLQAKYSGDWWDIVSAATVTVPPGDFAEAKFRCHTAGGTQWRSVIDVDLVERPDDGEDLVVTPPKPFACRPDVAALHR